MPAALGTLRIVTVNVNGLHQVRQRLQPFFEAIISQNYDVVIIQETHCSDDAEAAKWMRITGGPGMHWKGQAFWSHGTSASRGVAILVK
jgi:exonuclease III